jgi:vacuolar-type H+-ATPase subunit F/Vma7
MVFLNINTNNYKEKNENGLTKIQELNNIITGNASNKVFIFYYMEGCGPCNNTKPEWKKLENIFKNLKYDSTIGIADVNKDLSSKVKDAKQEPNSFPTIRFITNKGKTVEDYEDSNIKNKDKTIDSFVEWIKFKMNDKDKNMIDVDDNKSYVDYNTSNIDDNKSYVDDNTSYVDDNKSYVDYNTSNIDDNKSYVGDNKSYVDENKSNIDKNKSNIDKNKSNINKNIIKTKLGGKWTKKYKRSINCKKPHGFSQKQYCKYSRNKTRRNKTRLNKKK